MEPISLLGMLGAGAISGGIQLIGNLFGAKSERESQERQAQQNLATNQLQMTQSALQGEREAQQGALGSLIQAYRQGLG